jgi:AcrR family transcriptional regulator
VEGFQMPDLPRRKKARGPKETRGRILEAAADLFARHGYHATSMRQVARRARVVPAAIYNHFESKERLFLAAFLEKAPQRALAEALDAADGVTAEALLRNGLHRMRQAMASRLDELRLVFVEVLEFDGKHAPDLAGLFLPRILNFVQRLQDAPGNHRPVSAILVMRAVLGLFMSFTMTQAFISRVPGLEDDPAALDGLGDILLYGIMNPAAPPKGQP